MAFALPIGKAFSDLMVVSPFGPRLHPILNVVKDHTGADLAAAIGTPVRASLDGQVIKAWDDQEYGGGNSVRVLYPEIGKVFGYAHLNRIFVATGYRVKAGQLIAETGNTGASTGPHLHFSIKDAATGIYTDPIAWLRGFLKQSKTSALAWVPLFLATPAEEMLLAAALAAGGFYAYKRRKKAPVKRFTATRKGSRRASR